MATDGDHAQDSRERVARVYRYLKALNQHRSPAVRRIDEQPWSHWLRDLPRHPSIRLGQFDVAAQPAQGSRDGLPPRDDFVLKVARPRTTRAPRPPDEIVEWLERGWENPAGAVRARESQNHLEPNGDTRIVRFEDDPERVRGLETWKLLRDEWARNELPARAALQIYEDLAELRGRIGREGERLELVLGDGMLGWSRPEGSIWHPVLLQRVQLEFDPNVPEFTVVETEHKVELYTALFWSIGSVDGKALARCQEDLDREGYHPLGGDETSSFLRRLVAELSTRGEFAIDGVSGASEDPRIGRRAVLFLRMRTLGFATAIDSVLEDIESGGELPQALLNLVGVEPASSELAEECATSNTGVMDEDVLFSKPANEEQERIARRLQRHGCVLVQGPPGTGKTHTIANLLGHLLAEGRSVLVTAHTQKALRVLRDQVVEPLRPLCVSVLDSDLESRRQLEGCVHGIVERLSSSDAEQLETAARGLHAARRVLLERLAKVGQEILDARAGEYRDIVIAGEGHTPSDAARRVVRDRDRDGWIPGPTVSGTALPLSTGEVVELYRTNVALTPEDEAELESPLPAPAELLAPTDFRRLITERARLEGEALTVCEDLWDRPPGADEADAIADCAVRLGAAAEPLSDAGGWKLAAVAAGWRGGAHRETWERLLEMIKEARAIASEGHRAFVDHAPTVHSAIPLETQRDLVGEILQHLIEGGKLNAFVLLRCPSWKRLLREARVAGNEPSQREHFQALASTLRLLIARRELTARWARQMAPLGAPASEELGAAPEDACAQYVEQIRGCLDWHAMRWVSLEGDLKTVGFRWGVFLGKQPPNPLPHGELLRLRDAIIGPLQRELAARANAARQLWIHRGLEVLERTLDGASDGDRGARVVASLRAAVQKVDADAYETSYERLIDLTQRRMALERRRELLARLEELASGWAAAVRNRRDVHGYGDVPSDPAAAWLWRQLHDELERRARTSLEGLQATAEQLTAELHRVTAELIDRLAWAAQVRRTELRHRQALRGWLDTVRKIGRGTGVRAPRLRAEATRLMTECRAAVPVWIMPLARVADTFDPRRTRFDVVVIDEASQSDPLGLLAFYLGRKVVVVGDHEQVSPAAVGYDAQMVDNLIAVHLPDIPNRHLYDPKTSVYDLAGQSFGDTICLLEHFRCVPEIIQFSNHLAYDGRIRPLRDGSRVGLRPHVLAYRVDGARSAGKVNEEEAWTVASLLAAAVEQPEYAGRSFGIISLVGEEQALAIERLLRQRLDPSRYEAHQIVCGNAAHFQGDERDVMFLSVVDSRGEGPLPIQQRDDFKQRLNVAASRARDQMWVVYSLDPRSDLKPGDLRRRLIEHAENPSAILQAVTEQEQRAESEFEKAVLRRLIHAGYRVRSQWKVGHYRIDLVVEGGGRRLAVECDGDRYHPLEKLAEDMARQAVLERLGWKFVRIRGSSFYRDPESAMRVVFEALDRLGVLPEPAEGRESEPLGVPEELKQRVVRRAAELRGEWREHDLSELPADDVLLRRRRRPYRLPSESVRAEG